MKPLFHYLICVAVVGIYAAMPFEAYAQQSDRASRDMKIIKTLDRKAEAMKKAIRKTDSHFEATGSIYYVAADGNDDSDGLSPRTALRTLDKVNSLDLHAGDAVLFRRGDIWRGRLKTRDGVSYSAYGKGIKPQLYGSPYDAARQGEWVLTETPNVYVYSGELKDDIGTLVFNNGESCALKVMKIRLDDGTTLHIDTREPFNDYRDLKRDLEFYHDFKDAHRVYLCSTHGNPAKRFKSIELLIRTNVVQATNNVVIDNLCIKYCGAHGIGSGTTKGLTVTNCELGWIGGSIQGEFFGHNRPTRYGNGVEIYGGCDYFLVDNCYIYQIYDAGATHQLSSGGTDDIVMKNVTYSNNLIEDCVYSIEYFMGRADNDAIRHMSNILICNNLLRRAGFGWGQQRPDKETPAQIKSWTHYNSADNFVIRDNIFDRSTHDLLNISALEQEWCPTLEGNTYIQYTDTAAGLLGGARKHYRFDSSIAETLKKLFGEDNATIISVDIPKE